MHWKHVWTVFGLFLLLSSGESLEDIISILQSLSKEDRIRFFTYQLYLEYFKRHANDLTRVREETTSKIYDYFLTKYRMQTINEEQLKYMTCQWIKINGECIDPDDPGVYPLLEDNIV